MPSYAMPNRFVLTVVAILLLAVLPLIALHTATEAMQSSTKQELAESEMAGHARAVEAGAPENPSIFDSGSWLLYGIYFGVCLLISSIFVYYARAYKAVVLRDEQMACAHELSTL